MSSQNYYYLCIKDWKQFQGVVEKLEDQPEAKWIFRGHITNLPLLSSLDRAYKYYPPESGNKVEVEENLLREFKRKYHQYSPDSPKENDYLEWFSIMQHYGAPTRLLDFTYSSNIAAYFALEHVSNRKSLSFEIFAVNAIWAINASEKICSLPKGKSFLSNPIGDRTKDLENFKKYFIDKKFENFVCPINPFRLTERLSLQKGVFMCPNDANATFEENLKSVKGWHKKDNIVRFCLNFKNKDEYIDAKRHLADLNITRTTLFPGLDGFARSLDFYPPPSLKA